MAGSSQFMTLTFSLAVAILAFGLPVLTSADSSSFFNGKPLLSRSVQSECTSLSTFCGSFVSLCLKACTDYHHPYGFSKRTPAWYKCDARGQDYYDIGCKCDNTDLTSYILSSIASSSHDDHAGTTTKTVTTTDRSRSTTTKTVTRTSTKTAGTIAQATVTFTKVIPTVVIITEDFTATDTTTATETITDVIPTTVTDTETVPDIEVDTITRTSFSVLAAYTTVPTTVTSTASTVVTSIETDTATATSIVIDLETVTSTSIVHTTSTSSTRTTVTTVFTTKTVVVPATSIVRTTSHPVLPVTFASFFTTTVTTIPHTSVETIFTTSTTTASSVHIMSTLSHAPREVHLKQRDQSFCDAYAQSCISICGGRLSDVRQGECDSSQEDVYRLLCICNNRRDMSEETLCGVENGNSGSDRTFTTTTTVRLGPPGVVTATRTALITTTEAVVRHTFTTTVIQRSTSTKTRTKTAHRGAKTTVVVPVTATVFSTSTAFETTTVHTPTTTTTTFVTGETSVSFSTALATVPVFVTETSTAYATTTVTVTATTTDTETTTIGAIATEVDVVTDVASVSAFSTGTAFSTSVATFTSVVVGADQFSTVITVVTQRATATPAVVVTTTSVIPYTTVVVVSPTGVIQIHPGGFIANTLFGPNTPGESVLTNTSSIASAMHVVLLAAAGSTNNGVYLFNLTPPPGATAAEVFVGVTERPFAGGNFDSTDIGYLVMASYGPEGPPSASITNTYTDHFIGAGGPVPAEAVVFTLTPPSLGLHPLWILPSGTPFAATVQYLFVGTGAFLFYSHGQYGQSENPSASFTFQPL